jgi:hypothetical protein
MKVMRHKKKGSKVGGMKEMLLKISVSFCITVYYYSVICILEFKLGIMINWFVNSNSIIMTVCFGHYPSL